MKFNGSEVNGCFFSWMSYCLNIFKWIAIIWLAINTKIPKKRIWSFDIIKIVKILKSSLINNGYDSIRSN